MILRLTAIEFCFDAEAAFCAPIEMLLITIVAIMASRIVLMRTFISLGPSRKTSRQLQGKYGAGEVSCRLYWAFVRSKKPFNAYPFANAKGGQTIKQCAGMVASVLVQILFWHVILRNFARPDLTLIGVRSIFHAAYGFGFQVLPFFHEFFNAL